MKKTAVFLCIFLAATALYARAIQEDYRASEEKARVSYAFGMIIGSNLSTAPIEFDYDAFAEGMRASMEDSIQPLFSEHEAMEIVETALHRAMEKAAESNYMLEMEFLVTNSQRPEVHVTASGLQYEIINETEGEKPNVKSIVRVIYEGTFTDGRPFDSSSDENGAYIPLELVIAGWTEGLTLMSVGSIYRFYIPSNLAYGKDGIQGIIPPYSTLIFLVELLEIINEPQEF
ncbi:MAG: FKBP-type peptidyl-prolyl cis-trans isomerase [Treponema sp.]|nr:FKBP-type peptidyl-prolyl cis-trans isomerase [Treponema sp.]